MHNFENHHHVHKNMPGYI